MSETPNIALRACVVRQMNESKMPAKPNDSANDNPYTEQFFQDWLDKTKQKVQSQLPKLNQTQATFFVAACTHVQDCNAKVLDATKKRDDIRKHKPVDQDALDKAEQAIKDATAQLDRASDDALEQSLSLLKVLEHWTHSTNNELNKDVVMAGIITTATPKGLASYCQTSPLEHVQRLVALLQASTSDQWTLLQQMAVAGGAKKGKWGPALDIYTQLTSDGGKKHTSPHPVLQRLQLAVALELADPLPVFSMKDRFIDPVARYIHYEQAWMFGELDPAFDTFTVWELRHVVNSPAPNDQLGWGRQMLCNYRPDLAYADQDPKWRYCRIVRTDVNYTMHPNWDPSRPLDFPQILSGGGACGPRAWMGRFICRAFGIPVWGVREPGHAAMARWTPDGWTVCLGAAMPYAWWDERCGLEFELETKARKVCADSSGKDGVSEDLVFGGKVLTLEWVSAILGEPSDQVRRKFLVDPKAMWLSLSMMERKRLVKQKQAAVFCDSLDSQSTASSCSRNTRDLCLNGVASKLQSLALLDKSKLVKRESVKTMPKGTIIIPAASCVEPKKSTGTVIYMLSFLGGQQLYLERDGAVKYVLSSPSAGKYNLTCRIATVHDDPKTPPLLITIDTETDNNTDDYVQVADGGIEMDLTAVYSVKIPYTEGMWQLTPPIQVELPSNVASCTIALAREASSRGMAMKDIWLTPV